MKIQKPLQSKALLKRFLYNQDISENTRKTYEREMTGFIKWIRSNRIINPDGQDILDYKNYLISKELSPLTISSYIVAVRKFFSWCESLKIYPDISKNIKGMKRVKGFRKDSLSLDQIHTLLKSIKTRTLEGKRDFAIINLMIRTGLREIEIIRSNVEDIRQKNNEAVLYIQGKGRVAKDDFVLLTQESIRPIRNYLKARGQLKSGDPLFASCSKRNFNQRLTTNSVSRLGKKYLRRSGINSPRVTVHSLRHTAITLCLMAGATLQEAKELARHTDINTTLIYSHNIDRFNNPPEKKIQEILSV